MEKAQEFVSMKTESPKIFYIWGHAYEFDADPSYWDRIDEFCKLISGKEDIFYGTNTEILLK
jgi:predicted HD phosphohydrolase